MELLDKLVVVLLRVGLGHGDDVRGDAAGVVEVGHVTLLDEGERDAPLVGREDAAVGREAVDDGGDLGARLVDGEVHPDVVIGRGDVVDDVAVDVDDRHVGAVQVVGVRHGQEARLRGRDDDSALRVSDGDVHEVEGSGMALVEQAMDATCDLVLIELDPVCVVPLRHVTTFHSFACQSLSPSRGSESAWCPRPPSRAPRYSHGWHR